MNVVEGLSESLLGPSHRNVTNAPSPPDEEFGPAADTVPMMTPAPSTTSAANPNFVETPSLVANTTSTARSFRDAWAALLFLVKQGAILYLALYWGWPNLTANPSNDDASSNLRRDSDANISFNYHDEGPRFLYENSNDANAAAILSFGTTRKVILGSSIAATLLGMLLLRILTWPSTTRVVEYLIKGSLVFSLACQVGVVGYFAYHAVTKTFLSSSIWWWLPGIIVSICLGFITAGYAKLVWHRIPLAAAAHLQTSITAIQASKSIFLATVLMTLALLLWVGTVWLLAAYGVYSKTTTLTNCNAGQCTVEFHGGWLIFLLVLSLFWTVQVTQNIVHVTVCGTVGTWWFCPEQTNTSVRSSWCRAVSYSLGSICLGSLFAAILHTMHAMVRMLRSVGNTSSGRRRGPGDGTMVFCVLECATRCTERLLTYFNKWAFVYVGLYGYDYLTAGSKVMQLFQERGWTNLVQDDLIQRVLQLASWALGGLTATMAVALTMMTASESPSKATIAAIFALALGVGAAIGQLIFGVVASAVDTCLVAWAEAPLELERHYPGLYAVQVAAWRQAYPTEFDSTM